jgi:uncharacterized protein DUF998
VDAEAAGSRNPWWWAGIAGPILFVAVFLVEGALRAGYDPVRMQVSYLSLGDRGPIQVASFLGCGALLGLFSAGLRRQLAVVGGPGCRIGPIAIGAVALGLIVAGIFSTMPAFGYPPGTPDAFPTDIPPNGYLHVAGALLFFGGMIAAPLVLARRFRSGGLGGWSWASIAVAVVVLVAFGASSADPSGRPFVPAAAGLLQRIAIVAGLGWIAAVAALDPAARGSRAIRAD